VKGPASGGIQIAAGNNRPTFFKRPVTNNKSKFGGYAAQVQARITDALRNNPRTRMASMKIEVRIWADSTGRVTRATLGSSTGDSALDTAIRDEVLNGLQLSQPPPSDMPMPIVMRLSARRPN
jgi:TonB family protein